MVARTQSSMSPAQPSHGAHVAGPGSAIATERVVKVFRHRPSLFNLVGHERSGRTVALIQVSLSVNSGTALAVVGPNGSGKTTLLRLISTMLLPDSGHIRVEGADTHSQAEEVRRNVSIAVTHERSFFPRLTARENLEFFATLDNVPGSKRREVVPHLLELNGLAPAADTLTYKFSSGMFQKLGIARALLKKPKVLLLDEPTRSIDPGDAQQFWSMLRALVADGMTIVLATHNFEEACSVADRVVVLREGTIAGQRTLAPGTSVDELRQFYFTRLRGAEQTDKVTAGRPV